MDAILFATQILDMVKLNQFSSDKILKHLVKVTQWANGANPMPVTVELDMTNQCNQNCPSCVDIKFRQDDRAYMPRELAEKIIHELALYDVGGVIFTGGGEPLIHQDTPDMVKLASKLMDVGFITNGQLLTENIAIDLVLNCEWIRVSMDASGPGTYVKVHGAKIEDFEKLVDNIKMLVDVKKRLGGATIGLGFLTSEENRWEIPIAASMGRELGVDYLQFRPYQSYSGDCADVTHEIETAVSYTTPNYKVLFSKHKYDMMKDSNFGRDYGLCYGQQFATTIAASGKMYVCCHFRGVNKYEIGDLHKNTFREIWQSDKRRDMHKTIDFKDCIPLCRCNTFNQILWNLKQPVEHENFL